MTAFVFPALLKARNGLCKRLFSKPAIIKTHSGQRIQRQVFRWRGKISFIVRVVEADGATVSESRGATLWLLQSLARQYWMLNNFWGMGRRRWREQFSPSLAKISGSDNKKNARKTICTISSGKTPRLNCPGGRALLTQMLSPVLTGKLIAKKNRE